MIVYFRVIDVEPDPIHPTRPKINFAGELDGNFSLVGSVQLTPDEQVWWHFVRFSYFVYIRKLPPEFSVSLCPERT